MNTTLACDDNVPKRRELCLGVKIIADVKALVSVVYFLCNKK